MASTRQGTDLGTLGNYDLIEKIGGGSFGTVFKGRHWETNQLVAIKVISPTIAKNPKLFRRFQQECELTNKIKHPNIVRVLEYCNVGPKPFLVMELVEGPSLGERLEVQGKMHEAEAIRLIVQVAQGLEQVHRLGLLHRDIKPDNILLDPDGTAKLADMGLAKNLESETNITRTGAGLGTPNFIAPEQFRDAKNVDHRSDVYSLGACLYQMVTGVLPYADTSPVKILMRKLHNNLDSPKKLEPRLSHRTTLAILRALEVHPEKRPNSCWEFVEDLVNPAEGQGLPDYLFLESSNLIWYLVAQYSNFYTFRYLGRVKDVQTALLKKGFSDLQAAWVSQCMAGPFEPLSSAAAFADFFQSIPPEFKSRFSEANFPTVPEKPEDLSNAPTTSFRKPTFEALSPADTMPRGTKKTDPAIRENNPPEELGPKQSDADDSRTNHGPEPLPTLDVPAVSPNQPTQRETNPWPAFFLIVVLGAISFIASQYLFFWAE